MTRYFEVLRRDGPARLGRLLLEEPISTPSIISEKDYISPGSIFNFGSVDEALENTSACLAQKKLLILPYVPSALHLEPALKLPFQDIEGPKGLVIHPFFLEEPQKADLYVIGSAGSLRNPKDLVSAVVNVRNRIPADAALYAPALATPSNVAFLAYMGIDLVDATRPIADAYFGRYHTRDGAWSLCDLQELPCQCLYCQQLSGGEDAGLLAGHNALKLEEELMVARSMLRRETIREYAERQVRVTPELTAALRLLDQEHSYLEARTPSHRRSTLFANSSESLKRVEVTRFAHRVLDRYSAPHSDVLLLLPCSSRKPYSTSKSHRLFQKAIGASRRRLHEVILTSPMAVVPRELEGVYPAASYDVPVTGHWDLEERAWLLSCLDAYLEKNRYSSIVAHLGGELRQTVEGHGIDAIYTGGGTDNSALAQLSEAVQEACQGASRLKDMRLGRYGALANYYFGAGSADLLLKGKVSVKGREIRDEAGGTLAMHTTSGSLALSILGAMRIERLGRYVVTIGDFLPKGSLLAPGVVDADEQIRPGDEIIIRGEKAFGVGRARMSGWEMQESSRGVAAELRQIRAP